MASRDEGQGHRPPCPAWRNPVLVQAGFRRGAVIRNPLPQTIGAAHQVFWNCFGRIITGMAVVLQQQSARVCLAAFGQA